MSMSNGNASREPWNEGKIVGQKAPFKLKDIWEGQSLRHTLQQTQDGGVSTRMPERFHAT